MPGEALGPRACSRRRDIPLAASTGFPLIKLSIAKSVLACLRVSASIFRFDLQMHDQVAALLRLLTARQ